MRYSGPPPGRSAHRLAHRGTVVSLRFGTPTAANVTPPFGDEETLDDFTKGNFELGAQASAVALTKGASMNADFADGVAVFTQTKGGMMFDVSVGGQKFTFEPK